MENYIAHIGNENSGRYPRGSGKNPYQRDPRRRKSHKLTKEDLLTTRDAKLAYKYRDKYSNEELQRVLSRLNMEENLRKIAQKDNKGANTFVKTLLSYGKTMNEVLKFIDSPAGKMLKRALL